MKDSIKLINFNVPENLKLQFDQYCQILGVTRSKVLNDMIQDYLLDNEEIIAAKLGKSRQLLESQNRSSNLMRFREFIRTQSQNDDQESPPSFFISEHD